MPTTPDIEINGQPVFEVQLQALSEGRDGNGVAGQSDLKVTDGTGDNEANIATGTAYYNGSEATLGSSTTVTHSTGDQDHPRWDIIAFDVSTGSVNKREGTPTAPTNGPEPPGLNADEVLLALVYVESQQTDFGSDDIVNFRIVGGSGITASDDGTEKVARVTDFDGVNGIQVTDSGGGVAKVETDLGNALEHSSGQIAVSASGIDTNELATPFTDLSTLVGSPITAGANVDLNGNDLEDAGTTIWDQANSQILQAVLENDTITRSAGTGLTYSSGSAGTALGSSSTLAVDQSAALDWSAQQDFTAGFGGNGSAVAVQDDLDLQSSQSLTNASEVSTEELSVTNEAMVEVEKTSDQSFSSSTWATVGWDNEVADATDSFDMSNDQFIPPEDSVYLIAAQVRFSIGSDGDDVAIRLRNVTDGATVFDIYKTAYKTNARSYGIISQRTLNSSKTYELQVINNQSSDTIEGAPDDTFLGISRVILA